MEYFDYVIVGGGTAGCVLANRLTESLKYKVLVLEAGGADSGFWIPIPAGFSKLLTNAKYNWRFQTEPEENVHNRTIVVPRGKGLGGSTLINGMIFVRGQPQDYDTWAQRGATGWSFQDVLPYFKKLESFEDGESEMRGGSGPLNVVRVSERPEPSSRRRRKLAIRRTPTTTGPIRKALVIIRSISAKDAAGALQMPISALRCRDRTSRCGPMLMSCALISRGAELSALPIESGAKRKR
jgi:choline dehydrogenase-like flavoprotein